MMKKRTVSLIIGASFVAIIAVFVLDYLSKRPGKQGPNPYAYDVKEYAAVDPEMIHYRETKNFPVKGYTPSGIDVYEGKIWLTGNEVIQVIGMNGVQVVRQKIDEGSTCIKVLSDYLFVGFNDHVKKYTHSGELISEWEVPGLNCVFTSLAANEEILYVADAGNRRVLMYDFEGNLKGEFKGKAESDAGHGFIVPSSNFDLVVNSYGELWVVNPGKHAIENYSNEGVMRGFWQNSNMRIEGFTGCCNPAEMAVLPDGSFVTSEKGMVRIKVYDSSGKLISVVASPEKFDEEGHAPEVAVDENGVIYALDFDRSMVRVFEKK